jgi:hypothetical protein
MGLASPDGGLGREATRDLSIDAPPLDECVLGHAPDRDSIPIGEDKIVVELVLEDLRHIGPVHQARKRQENRGVLGRL